MKDTKLGFVSICSFRGKLLIAIDEKWKNFFQDIPAFEVIIASERYTLRGPRVSLSPRCADPTDVTGGYYG